MSRKRISSTSLLSIIFLSAVSTPVAAQVVQAPPCVASRSAMPDGGSPLLLVACGHAAAALGRADNYTLVQLPAQDAVAVFTTLDGAERAWLLIKNGERTLSVEEITKTVTRLEGRAGGNSEGLSSAFRANAESKASVRSLSGNQPSIDLAQLVQRARSVRMHEKSVLDKK